MMGYGFLLMAGKLADSRAEYGRVSSPGTRDRGPRVLPAPREVREEFPASDGFYRILDQAARKLPVRKAGLAYVDGQGLVDTVWL
jgi:hypothetical protein